MKFNERSKAIIFIVSSIIHFSWLFAPIIDIDKFRSAEFSDNILAILMIVFISAVLGFITLMVINVLITLLDKFNNFNNAQSEKNKTSDIKLTKKEKKYSLLTSYWGGVVEGVTRLENGEKFNQDTFYNKKYLKYPLQEIKDALIWSAVKYGGKNTKYFEACQGTYMFLASFSTNIRDKKSTGMSDMNDIIGKYPNEIIKEDKKQFDKLIKEIASMKKEDKKYSSSNLLKFQMQHTAEFSAIIKKIVSMAEKDIAKNK